MGISSINPFAIGNTERSYGASTYRPVAPVQPGESQAKGQIQGFKGFASIDDIEKASQFLEGNVNLSSKVNKSAQSNPMDNRGAGWEGFSVPANNGTGELSPQYGEDERIFDIMA